MNKEFSATIERLYSHFLMRDLVYVVAGGLVLTVTIYTVQGLLCYDCVNLFFAIGYLFASYITGIIIQEGAAMVHVVKILPRLPDRFTNYVQMFSVLVRVAGPEGIREYERIVFLKHIGTAIGPASLVCSIIFVGLTYQSWTLLHLVGTLYFLISSIVCLWLNRYNLARQEEILAAFFPN